MTMLKQDFEPARMKKALEMLLIDRKNEFRTLEEAIFWNVPESKRPIKEWEEFILNFCLWMYLMHSKHGVETKP